MKILALDVSTRSTGWYITKRSCGLILLDKNLSIPEKLCVFRDNITSLVTKYEPDVVVIEDTYLVSNKKFTNVHTLKQLCKFAGVAIEASARCGVDVQSITATQARKYCCGKQQGRFKKEEVFNFFVKEHDFDKVCQRIQGKPCNFNRDNDITDAAALALAYKTMLRDKGE